MLINFDVFKLNVLDVFKLNVVGFDRMAARAGDDESTEDGLNEDFDFRGGCDNQIGFESRNIIQ